MSRKQIIAVTVTCALLGVVPAAAQGHRPKPQPQCGDVITHSVKLRADLQCDASVGLTIGADGITVDLGGHRIAGSQSYPGIVNDGFDDVGIRNGTITGFASVIKLANAHRNRLMGLTGDTVGIAVLLEGSSQTMIDSVRMQADEVGLRLRDSDANRIVDSSLSGRTPGVSIVRSDGNRFVRTHMGGETGLNVFQSEGNRFVDGSIFGDYDGALVGGAGNAFVRNELSGGQLNFGSHLALEGDGNVVRANTLRASSSPQPALVLEGGRGNIVRDNQLVGVAGFGSEKDGILIDAPAVDTLVIGNLATDFPDDGIDIESASTTLRHNVANDNGDLGIEAVPGVRGKHNTAIGNGNPLQCLNITCS